jgi:hypothetical protein
MSKGIIKTGPYWKLRTGRCLVVWECELYRNTFEILNSLVEEIIGNNGNADGQAVDFGTIVCSDLLKNAKRKSRKRLDGIRQNSKISESD